MQTEAYPEMHIDCATCPVREVHCDDCAIGVLFRPGAGALSADLPLDRAERAAVTMLVATGMVSAREAGELRARREPFGIRAVG